MDIQVSLYNGQLVRLGGVQHEQDAPVEALWHQDPVFLRSLLFNPAQPLSTEAIKKQYEALEKEADEKRNQFYFTLRTCGENRLVGFVHLKNIEWSTGSADIKLGIGCAEDRGKGYGSEALRLLLRFAFHELNLYRLNARIAEDNTPARRMLENAGFRLEINRRKAIRRDGKKLDLLGFGILAGEWQK